MKKWLAKKLYNLVRSYEHENMNAVVSKDSTRMGLDDHNHHPINFSVYTAQGGRIVEVRQRDRRTDNWDVSLHVIKSDEDFGKEIANIIFMETLKRGT